MAVGTSPERTRSIVFTRGWRTAAWFLRYSIILTLALVVLIEALIIRGVTPLDLALGYAPAPVAIVAVWIALELLSLRGVEITGGGVLFYYRIGRRFVPWSRLRLSARVEPAWIDSVVFLESGIPALGVRAHRVTRQQARVIIEGMPTSP